MEGVNSPTVGSVLIGVVLLYVGWANAWILLPPFACSSAADGTLRLGANLALVYARGCELSAFAHAVFALVTMTGAWVILDGLFANPQRRREPYTRPERQSQYRFDEADFDVE